MNNLYKILVILLLALLCALVLYTSVAARENMLRVCPTNAISQQNNVAVIDSLKCINCGRCFLGIPSPYNFTLFPNVKPKPDSGPELVSNPLSSSIADSSLDKSPGQSNQKAASSPGTINKTRQNTKTEPNLKTVLKTFFTVNKDVCIGCQLCVSNCPTNAITMVDGKAVIDPEKCIACGICVNGNGDDFGGCPVQAISKVTKEIKIKK